MTKGHRDRQTQIVVDHDCPNCGLGITATKVLKTHPVKYECDTCGRWLGSGKLEYLPTITQLDLSDGVATIPCTQERSPPPSEIYGFDGRASWNKRNDPLWVAGMQTLEATASQAASP